MNVPTADLERWLRGRWTVDRRINEDGRFHGGATFAPDAGRVRWHEEGTLTLDGHTGPATRLLTLEAAEPGGAWQVRFDDGRLFHDLDLSAGCWTPEHGCPPDHYRGEYVVGGLDELTVSWRVSGPGRDDLIHSIYRRVPQAK